MVLDHLNRVTVERDRLRRMVNNYLLAARSERMCPNCGKHPAWWRVNEEPSDCPICEDWRLMPPSERAGYDWADSGASVEVGE
jgi:hypothetical protein